MTIRLLMIDSYTQMDGIKILTNIQLQIIKNIIKVARS